MRKKYRRPVYKTLLLLPLLISLIFAEESKSDLRALSSPLLNRQTLKVWIYIKHDAEWASCWEEARISNRTRSRLQRIGAILPPIREYRPTREVENQLAQKTLSLRYYSKMLKAYSAIVATNNWRELQELPFIERIEPVALLRRPTDEQRRYLELAKVTNAVLSLPYYSQLAQLNIPRVHQLGITGRGVRIGIIDTGFNFTHEVFQSLLNEGRLIAQRDFINDDNDVSDEDPSDVTFTYRQSVHGTAVWGLIAGNLLGKYLGAAYDAEFVLAKTEEEGKETRLEEDNFIAAVEWCDELGVDIISVSLWYRDFDDFSYDYLDLDGKSTKVARAVNWAFQRGTLVVAAAGNSKAQYSDGGLGTPADAFGALTVGAVDSSGVIAYFSSNGFTADGRIKPDLCARGFLNYLVASANPSGYYFGSGTSFATPLIAGAAALILQRYPHFTPGEIIDQLKRHANRSTNPAPPYGWGIPDIYRAVTDTTVEEYTGVDPQADQIMVYPNPVRDLAQLQFIWHLSRPLNEKARLRISDLRGAVVIERELTAGYLQRRESLQMNLRNLPNGLYLVYLESKSYQKRGKFLVLH